MVLVLKKILMPFRLGRYSLIKKEEILNLIYEKDKVIIDSNDKFIRSI